jgi:hypothetical protein
MLQDEGSGAALLAPGDDEMNSYVELLGSDDYYVRAFGDPLFLPLAGCREANGFVTCVRTLHALYDQARKLREEGKPLKYKGLVIDTISGMATLAVNQMMSKCGIADAPAAQSPEGFRFYGGIRNILEQYMGTARALKGLGMHLVATAHVGEKKISKTSMAEQQVGTGQLPLITGSFREVLPAAFDIVCHAGIQDEDPRYYLQWVSQMGRPTKSRVGPLSTSARLPNEWSAFKPLITEALERRAAKAAGQSRREQPAAPEAE